MAHKCDGCRYKGEHQEMMFQSIGVCNREHNLIEAEKAYNAEKCPFTVNRFGEWISVDERLPEKDGRYLVYDVGQHRGVDTAEIRITHFKKGDRYHDYMWRNHYSHWMPLPEPPMMKGGAG